MSEIAIKFENISKQYRLGKIGTGTISHDLNRWWTVKVCGKADPYLKIGATNDRSLKADSEYVWALRDINLEVKQGEVLGIIGKNGAGKSTLLKLLSRVTTPTTGRILSKGRIASLLEVGTGFHPEMTGRENIYMNGSIMGMTKAEIVRKFDEIVDFAGVAKYIETPVKRYSSGMMVRLGFAIAAHLEPEILVVDEVLAVGDAEFQKKALGKMQDVSNNAGRTVLFVSHNMPSVKNLCSRCIILRNGIIQFSGNTTDAVDLYLSDGVNVSETGVIPPGMKRNYAIGSARFTKVQLINAREEVHKEFYYGEPIKMEIKLEVISEMKDYSLAVMIGTLDGQRVLYSELNSDQISDTDLPQVLITGEHIIEMQINTPLLPGAYSTYLGVSFLNGKNQDWVERVYDFHVNKTGFIKDQYYRWPESHGYVLNRTNWKIKQE